MPMNAILTIMAVVTLVVGVYLNQKGTQEISTQVVQAPSEQQVLSEQSERVETPQPTSTPSPAVTAAPSNLPTATSTATTNEVVQEEISSFIYPGASISVYTSSQLNLTSTEPHQKIIDWYKEKIKQLSFSAKSTVQTSTNGKIVAKIAAARNNFNVDISINKENNSNVVAIVVALTK